VQLELAHKGVGLGRGQFAPAALAPQRGRDLHERQLRDHEPAKRAYELAAVLDDVKLDERRRVGEDAQ
jgi:hypothetical protein